MLITCVSHDIHVQMHEQSLSFSIYSPNGWKFLVSKSYYMYYNNSVIYTCFFFFNHSSWCCNVSCISLHWRILVHRYIVNRLHEVSAPAQVHKLCLAKHAKWRIILPTWLDHFFHKDHIHTYRQMFIYSTKVNFPAQEFKLNMFKDIQYNTELWMS